MVWAIGKGGGYASVPPPPSPFAQERRVPGPPTSCTAAVVMHLGTDSSGGCHTPTHVHRAYGATAPVHS